MAVIASDGAAAGGAGVRLRARLARSARRRRAKCSGCSVSGTAGSATRWRGAELSRSRRRRRPRRAGRASCAPLSRATYAREGSVTLGPLDCGESGAVWHRLYLEASLPPNAGLRIAALRRRFRRRAGRTRASRARPTGRCTWPGSADGPADAPRAAWCVEPSELPFAPALHACPPRTGPLGPVHAAAAAPRQAVRRDRGPLSLSAPQPARRQPGHAGARRRSACTRSASPGATATCRRSTARALAGPDADAARPRHRAGLPRPVPGPVRRAADRSSRTRSRAAGC